MSDVMKRPNRQTNASIDEFVKNGVAAWVPQSAINYIHSNPRIWNSADDYDTAGSATTRPFATVTGTAGDRRVELNPNVELYIRGEKVPYGRASAELVDAAFNGKVQVGSGGQLSDEEKMVILRSFLGLDKVNSDGEYITSLDDTDFSEAIDNQWYARKLQSDIAAKEKSLENKRSKGQTFSTSAIRTETIDNGSKATSVATLDSITGVPFRSIEVEVITTTTSGGQEIKTCKPVFPEKVIYDSFVNMGLDPTDEDDAEKINKIKEQFTLNVTTGGEAGNTGIPRVNEAGDWIGAPPYNTHIEAYRKTNAEKAAYYVKKTATYSTLGMTALSSLEFALTNTPGEGFLRSLTKFLPDDGTGKHGGPIAQALHKAEPYIAAVKSAAVIVKDGDINDIPGTVMKASIPWVGYFATEMAVNWALTSFGAGLATGGVGLAVTVLYLIGSNAYDQYVAEQKAKEQKEQDMAKRAQQNGEWIEALKATNGVWTIQLGTERDGSVVPDGSYRIPVGYQREEVPSLRFPQRSGIYRWTPIFPPKDNAKYYDKHGAPLQPNGVPVPFSPPKEKELDPYDTSPQNLQRMRLRDIQNRQWRQQDNLKPRYPRIGFLDIFPPVWGIQQENEHNADLVAIHTDGKQNNFVQILKKVNDNNKSGGANLDNNGPYISTSPINPTDDSLKDAQKELDNIRKQLEDDTLRYYGSTIGDEPDQVPRYISSANNGVTADPSGRGVNIDLGPSIIIDIDGKPVKILRDKLGRPNGWRPTIQEKVVPAPITA